MQFNVSDFEGSIGKIRKEYSASHWTAISELIETHSAVHISAAWEGTAVGWLAIPTNASRASVSDTGG